MKRWLICSAFFLVSLSLHAQEVLLSPTEDYYDFLSLSGKLNRPTLNYRTLSDSQWDLSSLGDHVWSESNLGTKRQLADSVFFKIYGPEVFTSYNSAAPHGQNDGLLWQGRGLNGRISAGFRVEAYGLELTLKPEAVWSENRYFETVPSAYTEPVYAGKAANYGYYGVRFIDAPQRFGDDSFYDAGWGDSEIRYTFRTFTVGFGTQYAWLGPARINPVLLSNNAPAFPKFDLGFRPTRIEILGIDFGLFETRAWWGKLSESYYFDHDSGNDHNLFTGFTASYVPPFAQGLTLGFHRTMLSKWDAKDYESMLTLLWPFMDEAAGGDKRDQRASVSAVYSIPDLGFRMYLEWGRNDFSPNVEFIIRYPFHTQGYTFGGSKQFAMSKLDNVLFQLNVECTNLESSRDLELLWAQTFYGHHIIKQGHTHQGQWLGAGIGTGGNSQYIGLDAFYKKGSVTLSLQRVNPDNDYIWFMNMGQSVQSKSENQYKMKGEILAAVSSCLFINQKTMLNIDIIYQHSQRYLYQVDNTNFYRNTFNAKIGVKTTL